MIPILEKHMIYISLKDKDTNPHLCFEKESYAFHDAFRDYARKFFKSDVKDEVLDDLETMDYLGFHLTVRLFLKHNICDRYGRQWALVAYSESDEKGFSIKIDEGPCYENVRRSPCAILPLKSLSDDDTVFDNVVRMRAARIVVQNLL